MRPGIGNRESRTAMAGQGESPIRSAMRFLTDVPSCLATVLAIPHSRFPISGFAP
jgi:hypothetical protein